MASRKFYMSFGACLIAVCSLMTSQTAVRAAEQSTVKITNVDKCSATIGAGSNLYAPGIFYKGKCEGHVEGPQLIDGEGAVFKVLKGEKTPKDRSELADTVHPMDPGKTYYITASIQIPEQSDVTNEFFYILQLWQGPSFSPSAGIRITRGTSHKGQLMARNANNQNGHGVANIDFSDNQWHSFIIKVRMTKDNNGLLGIITPDGKVTEWKGKVGYSDDERANPTYRLKFGIYKGSESDRSFEVHERKVKIFEDLDDAQEYLKSDVVF